MSGPSPCAKESPKQNAVTTKKAKCAKLSRILHVGLCGITPNFLVIEEPSQSQSDRETSFSTEE